MATKKVSNRAALKASREARIAKRKKVTPKKPAKPAKKQDIVTTFLKALTEAYPTDAAAPGLVLAWVPRTQKFYASIARYPSRDSVHNQKEIVKTGWGDTPKEAIQNTMQAWKASNSNLIAFMTDLLTQKGI
jgi:hypothetical protein